MTVAELIEELQALNNDNLIVVDSDGDEVDSVEQDNDEVVLFTEADEDDDEQQSTDETTTEDA